MLAAAAAAPAEIPAAADPKYEAGSARLAAAAAAMPLYDWANLELYSLKLSLQLLDEAEDAAGSIPEDVPLIC